VRDKLKRGYHLQFVNRSFRDVADADYLAARVLHRHRLFSQFLWAGQQAIEKYLKAILLYNYVSARDLRHDLNAALGRVRGISGFRLTVPSDVPEFIAYLNHQGPNRYFEWGSYTLGRELLQLDRTVWHIRRYCRWLRGANDADTSLQRELAAIEAFPITQACRLRIEGGYLEEVLSTKPNTALRRQLVWKNLYFGTRLRRMVRYRPTGFRAANPTHLLRPDMLPEITTLVDFSKPIRLLLEKHGARGDEAVEQGDEADER
jgi:HEPN domain-containing protein